MAATTLASYAVEDTRIGDPHKKGPPDFFEGQTLWRVAAKHPLLDSVPFLARRPEDAAGNSFLVSRDQLLGILIPPLQLSSDPAVRAALTHYDPLRYRPEVAKADELGHALANLGAFELVYKLESDLLAGMARQLKEAEVQLPRNSLLDAFFYEAGDFAMATDFDRDDADTRHLLAIWRAKLTSFTAPGSASTLPSQGMARLFVMLGDTDTEAVRKDEDADLWTVAETLVSSARGLNGLTDHASMQMVGSKLGQLLQTARMPFQLREPGFSSEVLLSELSDGVQYRKGSRAQQRQLELQRIVNVQDHLTSDSFKEWLQRYPSIAAADSQFDQLRIGLTKLAADAPLHQVVLAVEAEIEERSESVFQLLSVADRSGETNTVPLLMYFTSKGFKPTHLKLRNG